MNLGRFVFLFFYGWVGVFIYLGVVDIIMTSFIVIYRWDRRRGIGRVGAGFREWKFRSVFLGLVEGC